MSNKSDIVVKKKNRAKTKEELIKSLQDIVIYEGSERVSIQRIAKNAGFDKVLIYRYFGNLDGIIEDFVSRFDFFDELFECIFDELTDLNDSGEVAGFLENVLIEFLAKAHSDILSLELFRWELNNKKVAEIIEYKRKFFVRTIFRELRKKFDEDLDGPEDIFNFLLGTLNFLLVKSINGREFGKMNFETDGWFSAGRAVSHLLQKIKKSTA